MRLLDPTLDVVFKLLLLRNPDLLRAHLEAVLGRRVVHVEVLNPEIPGDLSADKFVMLDLRVRLDTGERVDVEMQARSIAFLGKTQSHTRLTDHLAFHVLQLPEISQASGLSLPAPERALRNWSRFFTAPSERALAQLAREDSTMATAVEALERLSQDPDAQRLAREREDLVRLYHMSLAESRREGVVEGFEAGRIETQRKTIIALCASFGIELSAAQLATLSAPDADLDGILDTLIRERRWP